MYNMNLVGFFYCLNICLVCFIFFVLYFNKFKFIYLVCVESFFIMFFIINIMCIVVDFVEGFNVYLNFIIFLLLIKYY